MQKKSVYPSISQDAKWGRYLSDAITEGRMSASDGELITAYLRWKMSGAGIGGKRQTKLYQSIRAFRERAECDFAQLTETAWQNAIIRIRQEEEYADWTKSDIIGQVKAFMLWCAERKLVQLPAETIRNVKTPKGPKVTKTADDIPTLDEFCKLIQYQHCTIQQQALLAVAYYTGMRIGEILRLNWSDISFQAQGVDFLVTDTKTKKYRSVPCVEALPYVAAWRRQYPEIAGAPEGAAPVFVTKVPKKNEYRRMVYGSANMFLRRLQEATGVPHKSWHTFRSANITNCTLAGVPDSIVKDIHWGNQNTQMMATYVMISETQKEQAMYKRAGLKVDETRIINTPQNCPSCCALNGPGDQYCRMCGYPLSSKAVEKQRTLDEALEYVQKNYTLDEMIQNMASVLGITEDAARKLLTGGL